MRVIRGSFLGTFLPLPFAMADGEEWNVRVEGAEMLFCRAWCRIEVTDTEGAMDGVRQIVWRIGVRNRKRGDAW